MTTLNTTLPAAKTTKVRAIVYWTTLVILEFVILSGGVADIFHAEGTVNGMLQLGYPLYFVTILGAWKVLGGVALFVPRFPRLQEWAYAGIFFDLTGAALSHIAMKSDVSHVVITLTFALITVINWASRKNFTAIWKKN